MERRPKDTLAERRRPPPSPPPPPNLPSNAAPTKQRQWQQSGGPPCPSRIPGPSPPKKPRSPSPMREPTPPERWPSDGIRANAGLPRPDPHINPARPDAVINLIKRSSLSPSHGDPCTIHRVPPELLASGDMDASTPGAVCLGPYSRALPRAPGLKIMDDYKWWCVQRLVARYRSLAEPDRTPILIHRCVALMKAVDAQVRQAYARSIHTDDEELAEMMMLDGCFLLFLLLGRRNRELEDGRFGLATTRPWTWNTVMYDLLLLENQIPFFIIKILFTVFKTNGDEGVNLIALLLICSPRSSLMAHRARNVLASSLTSSDHIHHLLHLYYLSLLPTRQPDNRTSALASPETMPTVTPLQESGIKLRRAGSRAASFLDVEFKGGGMAMPALVIRDHSARLFANLVAFEQCHGDSLCHVTSFVAFMSCLVRDSMDMELLRANGIVVDRRNDGEHEGRK